MIILGIDPGQSGGFALVEKTGAKLILLSTLAMPLVEVRTKKALNLRGAGDWLADWAVDMGVIELVHAMPRQGVSSSFQFGRMFGAAEALMAVHCERWDYVIPRVWKQALGLSDKASASLDLATRLFGASATAKHWPLKKHEGIAEAALIAVHWLRVNGG